MYSLLDKELDLGHCKMMLFGEGLAQQDIRQAADWMLRRRDIQLLVFTAVPCPSAQEVLYVQPISERLSGNSLILALSKDGTESPFIVGQHSLMNLKGECRRLAWIRSCLWRKSHRYKRHVLKPVIHAGAIRQASPPKRAN
ncbi:hypothetical protein AWM70_07225 [Paenibacillus yonginensis]|uniref:Spore germination protein N-terminal domain-containing protein n=1 Tax=Paenibacillus yonginensis TaxID=1462996 RepID=A0A1B1MZ00_9BACL|nr:hypothetical protein AWM70_07225 [Paenibacillus yonginensis]